MDKILVIFEVRNFETAVLPESLNEKSPNFWKSQKTYIKGLPKVKNIYIKALKFLLKTGLNRFFDNF